MEEDRNQPAAGVDRSIASWRSSRAAELFERFLHTKFLGQKRFSLEGAESLIPLLDTLVENAPRFGIREMVLGMAHRGSPQRAREHPRQVATSRSSREFEDSPEVDAPFGSGDVKYHKGYSSDRRTRAGERVHLTLTVEPLAPRGRRSRWSRGATQAKQVRAGDAQGGTIVPVLLHGDAAFAGQGIVAETLNLSQLAGYSHRRHDPPRS